MDTTSLTRFIASLLYSSALAGGLGAKRQYDNGRKCLYSLAMGWDEAAWEFQYGEFVTHLN